MSRNSKPKSFCRDRLGRKYKLNVAPPLRLPLVGEAGSPKARLMRLIGGNVAFEDYRQTEARSIYHVPGFASSIIIDYSVESLDSNGSKGMGFP